MADAFCAPGPDPAKKWAQYGYGKGNWYYNTTTGDVHQLTGIQKFITQVGPGLSVSGPFPSQAQAEAFKARCPPTGVGKGVATAVGGAETVSTFLGKLSSANLWIRVGEVLLGLILLAVGVARITNAVPVATKIASVVR